MSDLANIGIFGGTFDPIHNTHCDIARKALECANLDRVFFVVSARPPHKTGIHGEGVHASAECRFDMVKAALHGEPRMEASRIEMDRTGLSFTIDTLRAFREFYPDARLHLIIGYDSLIDLPGWREPESILACANLLVIPRPGIRNAIPAQLEGHYEILPFHETTDSSSEIRERIAAGEPVEHLLPVRVLELIRRKGLYRAAC